MNKVGLNRRRLILKFTAVTVAVMIVISSSAMIQVMIKASPENQSDSVLTYQSYQLRPCEINLVLTQRGTWISFDSTSPGTPAKAQATISDTSGITIVADFHGFWRNSSFPVDGNLYDNLEMPGADSMQEPGKPMLPRLSELVEIPYGVDVSIEVIASSNGTDTGYHVRPAPLPNVPVGLGIPDSANSTPFFTAPTFFSSVYSNNTFFPGETTSIRGETSASSLILRGHRLLELNFYPVQFNPETNRTIMFSQLVIKLKYSRPAQIQPVRDSLRSEVFERILMNSLLYYDPIHIKYFPQPGLPTWYSRTPSPPPSFPNYTIPIFQQSQSILEDVQGAEYLIITTETLRPQAQRLAAWKEQKGIPSAVYSFSGTPSTIEVREVIEFVYNNWYPSPTYVLLFGDVEVIPTNYDMQHRARWGPGIIPPKLFQVGEDGYGNIASDLGYFNIEGHSYFPDMIYSRISVDTVEQAEVIVNKTLQYEQSPPAGVSFYNSILSAGYFEDRSPRDGTEDAAYPFIYYLERIRSHWETEYDYNVNVTYTCTEHRDPESFHTLLDPSDHNSQSVDYSLSDYPWMEAEIYPPLTDSVKDNITWNFAQGRFFVLYYGHGGSKNMVYNFDSDGDDSNDRDYVEGWVTPYFNTSYFSELPKEDKTPLIVSIACSTGWFDGETDQHYMKISEMDPNPFLDYDTECFAENITRMERGGAIAVIAPSRPGYTTISGDLLNGIIQAFWPGFLESESQPIYEMGAALLFGKLQTAEKWMGGFDHEEKTRTTFETFHLFGDPETQLWTDAPSNFRVNHPESIGVSNPQEFVVTVRDDDTGERVDYAKVCIQQDPYIYQVGYTDPNGQIIFDVDPLDTSSHLNVTVTKHNHRPYIGRIYVREPNFDSSIEGTPEPDTGIAEDVISITISGFNEMNVVGLFFEVLDDDDFRVATVLIGSNNAQGRVPEGPTGYVNVMAVRGNNIAVTRFYRLSTNLNPDPFIYSQNDPSTWYLAGDELVWDNPCITIYDGARPVTRVKQNRNYNVKVIVHNRGYADAVNTRVTLWYAQFGGGVSWTTVGYEDITINQKGTAEATFSWKPQFPNTASLNVTLWNRDENPKDNINNVGSESFSIVPLCSPGTRNFQVGNPTENTDYVFINVKQRGNHDDVWNVTIQDYSSQAMTTGNSETVSILIDPSKDIGPEEGRLFTAEIFVNGELVGGMVFDAECKHDCLLPWLLIILFVIIATALIVWYKRRE